ncbi:LLM class flavin-dependent oxidoreductase [Streptomyces marispadix]|uniref:LLM class flavin-dependent oxidoreductase n=1 Tax=Streptomyces marispadix TaxID=2922868 RepID=A0ABS9SVN6_9ACTN|nr:LLM class flavin-dependent oxidoreductase [Streptomyces marispadix]MCH6160337.1 LLM class flavin-dependent oxidoreductase [Streptomyces marispadix]
MRLSILLPFGPVRPEQVVPFANLVNWTCADRLWQGHGMLLDSHHLINWLAGIGIRIPSGFGVTLMPLRSPYQAAIEARSVALATGRSVVAGFGPGGLQAQRSFLGKPYAGQIGACREYVTTVRGLLHGETVENSGDHFPGVSKLLEYKQPPVSVGLGVLRERMAALAGELADVAITWLGSAAYLDQILMPAMRKGAEERKWDKPATVTAIVPVALSGPDRRVEELAGASCGTHIQAPHYQDALKKAGIVVSGDGDPGDAVKLVDGGVFLYGTAEEIHERLDEYRAIGVDEVVLNATGVGLVAGPRAAAQDLLEILGAAP